MAGRRVSSWVGVWVGAVDRDEEGCGRLGDGIPMPLCSATPDARRGSRDRGIHGGPGDGAPSYDGLRVCQREWRILRGGAPRHGGWTVRSSVVGSAGVIVSAWSTTRVGAATVRVWVSTHGHGFRGRDEVRW